MTSTADVQAQYVWDISLILDNDQASYFDLRSRVFQALRHSSGYSDMTPDDFDSAIREGRAWEFYRVVGGEVDEVLQDMVDSIGGAETVQGLLLSQLVGGLTEPLGRRYLMTTGDYRDMYEEAEGTDED
jgi:hypothetical protein